MISSTEVIESQDSVKSRAKKKAQPKQTTTGVLQLHELKPFSPVTPDQSKIIRSIGLKESLMVSIDQLTTANLVHGNLESHEALSNAINAINKRKYTGSVWQNSRSFLLKNFKDIIISNLLEALKSVGEQNGTNVSYRPEMLCRVLTVTQQDPQGNAQTVTQPYKLGTALSMLNVGVSVLWAGTVFFSRIANINEIIEKQAALDSDKILRKIIVLQESIAISNNLLAQAISLHQQALDITKEQEYDAAMETLKVNLLKNISVIKSALNKAKIELNIIKSDLVRQANQHEKLVLNSIDDNMFTTPKFNQSVYFEVMNMIYQKVIQNDTTIFLPDLFENQISEAKVNKLLYLSADNSVLAALKASLEMLAFILETINFRWGLDSSNQYPARAMLHYFDTKVPIDPSIKVTSPALWATALFTTKFAGHAVDLVTVLLAISDKKQKIYETHYNNVNALAKAGSAGLDILEKVPGICESLTQAHKSYSDATAKCVEGLNGKLTNDYVDSFQKFTEAVYKYLEVKNEVLNNYHTCCMGIKQTDPSYSFYLAIMGGQPDKE